eukprot:TRINITY_DN11261_c0_g1_i1.p1 TRINITY_DN11261_c0_g1~~TRINITY_DN11261_c0_g1_i1.p1  ORF type:complete len:920 (+),score=172.59 TRINITY_DN11261_c0_g1_i1:1281-4040(+)
MAFALDVLRKGHDGQEDAQADERARGFHHQSYRFEAAPGDIGSEQLAGSENFPERAQEGQGQCVADAHAQTVGHGQQRAVLGGKGLRPAQDDAVDHDQRHEDAELLIEGIGVSLHQEFHGHDQGCGYGDETGDADFGRDEFSQNGHHQVGKGHHEDDGHAHAQAVVGRIGHGQHRTESEHQFEWREVFPKPFRQFFPQSVHLYTPAKPRGSGPTVGKFRLEDVVDGNSVLDGRYGSGGGDGGSGHRLDVAAVFLEINGVDPMALELGGVAVFDHTGSQPRRFLQGGYADAGEGVGGEIETDHDAYVAAVALAAGLKGHGLEIALSQCREHSDRASVDFELFAVLDGVVFIAAQDRVNGRGLDVVEYLFLYPEGGRFLERCQGDTRQAADQGQDDHHFQHFFHALPRAERPGADALEGRGEKIGDQDGKGNAVRVGAVHANDDDHHADEQAEQEHRDLPVGRGRSVRGQEKCAEERGPGEQVESGCGIDARGYHVEQSRRDQQAADDANRNNGRDMLSEHQEETAQEHARSLNCAQPAQLPADKELFRVGDHDRVQAEILELAQGIGQIHGQHGGIQVHEYRPGNAAHSPAYERRAEWAAPERAEDHLAEDDGDDAAEDHQPPGGRGGQQEGEGQSHGKGVQVRDIGVPAHEPVADGLGQDCGAHGQSHDPECGHAEGVDAPGRRRDHGQEDGEHPAPYRGAAVSVWRCRDREGKGGEWLHWARSSTVRALARANSFFANRMYCNIGRCARQKKPHRPHSKQAWTLSSSALSNMPNSAQLVIMAGSSRAGHLRTHSPHPTQAASTVIGPGLLTRTTAVVPRSTPWVTEAAARPRMRPPRIMRSRSAAVFPACARMAPTAVPSDTTRTSPSMVIGVSMTGRPVSMIRPTWKIVSRPMTTVSTGASRPVTASATKGSRPDGY